jgi:hypothetical protein
MRKIILTALLFPIQILFSQLQFVSDEFGFEMTFPQYMVVNKGTTGNPAVIAAINENTFINVILQHDQSLAERNIKSYDLDSFISPIKETLSNELIGFKWNSYDTMSINGITAIYFNYNYYKGLNEARVKQYFMINNSKMYVITVFCLESEAADFDTVFNDCVNSFKFKN